MPDITMCVGVECPLKETCYRFTATPDEYMQSYFVEPPYKNGECEHYWIDKDKQKQLLTDIMEADQKDGLYENKQL